MCKLFLGILYWSAGLVFYKGNIEVLNACCKNLEMESTHRHTPCSELGLAGEKRSLAGSPLVGLWFDEYVFLPCALVSVYSFSHLKREISSVDSESYDTFKLYFKNFVRFDFIWKAEKWQTSGLLPKCPQEPGMQNAVWPSHMTGSFRHHLVSPWGCTQAKKLELGVE